MKNITDWLEDKLDDQSLTSGSGEQSGAYEQQAEALRAEAEADGFSAQQLTEACGGDIAAFLRDRVLPRASNDDGDIVGNAIPVPPLGFKQE